MIFLGEKMSTNTTLPPGVVRNSNEEYHGGAGISASGLKMLDKSPLHFWAEYLDPYKPDEDRKAAFVIGSAVHCAVLEAHDFPHRYGIKPDVSGATLKGKALAAYLESPEAFLANHQPVPDGIGKTKEGKALVAEIEANGKAAMDESVFQFAVANGEPLYGKELLKQDEYDDVMAMAGCLLTHPAGTYLLSMNGHAELSLYWNDPVTGVLCKCRPDYLIEPCEQFPNGLILDLKTTEDASPAGFTKSAYNFGYHIQAAWYTHGFQTCFKTKAPPTFVFGVVEKKRPYGRAFYYAGENQLLLGGVKWRELLNLYADCLKNGRWPSYPTEVTTLDLPGFALKEIEFLKGEK